MPAANARHNPQTAGVFGWFRGNAMGPVPSWRRDGRCRATLRLWDAPSDHTCETAEDDRYRLPNPRQLRCERTKYLDVIPALAPHCSQILHARRWKPPYDGPGS